MLHSVAVAHHGQHRHVGYHSRVAEKTQKSVLRGLVLFWSQTPYLNQMVEDCLRPQEPQEPRLVHEGYVGDLLSVDVSMYCV
jgi:hypothetical protein